VILEPGKHDEGAAVGDREERDLLALHELLDEDLGPGVAEAIPFEHVVDRAVGIAQGLADDHALASREPRCLHDDRCAEAACGSLGIGNARMNLGACGRNALLEEERLGEGFRRLDLRCRAGGPEDRQLRGAKPIDDARFQRRLRSDDGEIDGALAGETLQTFDVEHVDRHALPELGDAGIPGGGEQLEVGLFTSELPRERVLAPAAADEEYAHGGIIQRDARCAMRDGLQQNGLGRRLLPEAVAQCAVRNAQCAMRLFTP
jgi:hypothetical protein